MNQQSPLNPSKIPAAPRLWTATRIAVAVAILSLVIASFWSLALDWRSLVAPDVLVKMAEFLGGFAPPDFSATTLKKVANASLETIAMSAIGTLLAALFGLVLAFPASGRFGPLPKAATSFVLNLARAIPELVWASMMLIAAGLGPFAGTLALAAHTTGVFGRLYAECLENVAPQAQTNLRNNGASATAAFLYASLPQALPQILSYTLYRWENNIRAAAILGVVGAGGLGQMLKYHLSLFQMPSAATVMLAMLLLVAAVDALSFALRRGLMR